MFFDNILSFVNEIDGALLLFINRAHSDFLDSLMFAISDKWIWIPLYAFLVWRMALKERWHVVFAIICLALAITFSDQICSTVLRPLLGRLRPANLENPLSEFIHVVNDYRGGRYGFPSAHAANTFTLAVFISFMFRNRYVTLSMCGWALVVCYSRMYLGVHYPGDILLGSAIGSLAGFLFYRLYLLMKNRPELHFGPIR